MALNRSRRILATLLLVVAALWGARAQEFALPSAPNSVKFAVIGDSGTGEPAQYQLANQMARVHATFRVRPGPHARRQHLRRPGAAGPRQQVLEAVQGAARCGRQVLCVPGQPRQSRATVSTRCATWAASGTTPTRRRTSGSSRSTATSSIRSNWPGSRTRLKNSPEDWKICYFHHPLYSNGGTHGSSVDVRVAARAAVRRLWRQRRLFRPRPHLRTPHAAEGDLLLRGGRRGQLRKGDTNRSATTAKAFDQDLSFMLVEIDGDQLSFQAISRTGTDGRFRHHPRQARPGTGASAPSQP